MAPDLTQFDTHMEYFENALEKKKAERTKHEDVYGTLCAAVALLMSIRDDKTTPPQTIYFIDKFLSEVKEVL